MAKIQDIRHRTPFVNSRRAISAIKKIARHYSATDTGDFDSFWNHWNGVNGWGTGGYHEIILRDGTVQLCYDPTQITNGVGGQNSYIYNICLVGLSGFTAAQEKAWEERVRYWMKRLGLSVSDVLGHDEFPGQSTACPGINMDSVRSRLRGEAKPRGYLIQGDRGEEVKEFQGKLSELGHSIDVDGIFGAATKKVVGDFQRSQGLSVDGIIGADTKKMIGKLLKESKEVDSLTKYMEEKLPLTQQEDAANLFKWAHEEGYFSVDHSGKVKTMTRKQYYDLKESLATREKLSKERKETK